MLNNIISVNDIIKYNQLVSSGVVINNNINSCYSSIDYFDSKELSICSVFRSLCKNHYFQDGNKRVAAICLIELSNINNVDINLSNEMLASITLDVAKNHYTVEQICKLVFKK